MEKASIGTLWKLFPRASNYLLAAVCSRHSSMAAFLVLWVAGDSLPETLSVPPLPWLIQVSHPSEDSHFSLWAPPLLLLIVFHDSAPTIFPHQPTLPLRPSHSLISMLLASDLNPTTLPSPPPPKKSSLLKVQALLPDPLAEFSMRHFQLEVSQKWKKKKHIKWNLSHPSKSPCLLFCVGELNVCFQCSLVGVGVGGVCLLLNIYPIFRLIQFLKFTTLIISLVSINSARDCL